VSQGEFQGKTAISLDSKGRLAVPTRYRETIQMDAQNLMTITEHPDGYLMLFPRPQWLVLRNNAAQLDQDAAWWKRVVIGSANDIELDSAGRILVSPELREAAQINKDVLLIGMLSHFEIWDRSVYAEHKALEMSRPKPASLQTFKY
jgi:MraZ protein